MKKQVALALAATAAAVAGGLRLVQELAQREDPDPGETSADERTATATPPSASPPSSPKPATAGSPPGADFKKSSKADLYEVASEMGIAGRSKMNKAELIAAIEAAS